jgi:hypothetical protein
VKGITIMSNSISGLVRDVNPKVNGTPFELDFNDDETVATVLQYVNHRGVGTEEVTIGTVEYVTDSDEWVAHVTLKNGHKRTIRNVYRNAFVAARALNDFRVVKRDVFQSTTARVAGGKVAIAEAIDVAEGKEEKREERVQSRAERRAARVAAHQAALKAKQEKAATPATT